MTKKEDWHEYYKRKEKNRKKIILKSKKVISLKWFYFYNYIILPLRIILGILILCLGRAIPFSIFIILSGIILPMFLFYGLHKRKFWGHRLVLFDLVGLWLIGIIIGIIHNTRTTIIGIFLLSLFEYLAWIWPNWAYFEKRKYLFIDQ